MATKIRLQRHGKKGYAFYHIVSADSRAKRDGRFIEKIGTYNPNTNPATIDINFDRALYWVQVGAEMTDTARAILSYKGVLHKNHLLNGVKKGAFTEEEAEKKFEAWLEEKGGKITKKAEGHVAAQAKIMSDRLAAEKEVNEARAKELEAKNTPEVEEDDSTDSSSDEVVEETEASAEETPAEETANEETPADEPKNEEE